MSCSQLEKRRKGERERVSERERVCVSENVREGTSPVESVLSELESSSSLKKLGTRHR